MTASDPADSKFDLVDVVHEWLGQAGLRKIWGLKIMHFPDMFGYGDTKIADIFLREAEEGDWQGVPYLRILRYRVIDSGSRDGAEISASIYDPEFFVKLRKMLDYREQSNTIICRCPQCEGVKRD